MRRRLGSSLGHGAAKCETAFNSTAATTEHKTGKGKVEFLIPELTVKVLDLMSRYAKPLQKSWLLKLRNWSAIQHLRI